MAFPGLIRQTTLEAATEGVQVLTKVFEREIMQDAGQLGWFVDVTNDTFAFMRTDRDFKGFLFGAGGADTWDMGLKRLGTELMSFRNYPDDDDQTDFRVRELQASRIPHANVVAWGATGDGTTDDRSFISDALAELKTAGGGELFFPPGTFRMSTGISESDLKGITVRGSGVTTSTLKLDDVAARHFAFTASEGITFRDLTFQGAGSTTASNAGGGVNMPLGSKTFNEGHRFENVQFLSMSETAIEVPTSRGLVISNVKIEDNSLDMVDLVDPQATAIDSLLMINGQQRGLFVHGGGKDVSVVGSRAFQLGIGYEVDAGAVVFSGTTAEDGQNRSASFPGFGFVAGDTLSLVTLINTCVISTAGITAYVETDGAEFAKFNARQILSGVTTTQFVVVGSDGLDIVGSVTTDQLELNGALDALPSGIDSFGVIGRTGSGGSAPFNQAGSLIYRPRVTAVAGRSSHLFFTGSPSLERMRIDETGLVTIANDLNVGAAGSWDDTGIVIVQGGAGNGLDIKRAAGSVSARFITFGAVAAQQSSVVFGKSATDSIDTFAETVDNESLGLFTWEGVNSSSGAFGAAAFSAEQDGAADATRVPGRLLFKTSSLGAALVERMRIDSAGLVTMANNLLVSGVGPHAIGVPLVPRAQLTIGGSFVSGGGSDHSTGVWVKTDLTGADGDTDFLTLYRVGGGTITTQGNGETIGVVTQGYFQDPNITVGAGDTVTVGCVIFIKNGPSEAVDNFGIYSPNSATASVHAGVMIFGSEFASSEYIADNGDGDGIELIRDGGAILRLGNNGNHVADELNGKIEFWSGDASNTSSRIAGLFGLFADSAWNQNHPEGMFQWHLADGDNAAVERMRMDKNGRLAISAAGTIPVAHLQVLSNNAAFPGLIVSTAASATSSVVEFQENGTTIFDFRPKNDLTGAPLEMVASDFGDGAAGRFIFLGRNTNVTNAGASFLKLEKRTGTGDPRIWVDATADLRINSVDPTFANDTAGTVVGDQSSWYKEKYNIKKWDGAKALQRINDTQLYEFQFRLDGRRGDKTMHGFVIYDRDEWYGMNMNANQTPVLDQAEILGTLTAAVKHLSAEVTELKGRLNE